MSVAIDRELLAERAAAVDRHLRRVAEYLPRHAGDLQPLSTQTDAVVLHLWQAVQVVIDLAVSSCVRLGLGSPPTYADAFRMLAGARLIPGELAQRLGRAAGFRNLVESLDQFLYDALQRQPDVTTAALRRKQRESVTHHVQRREFMPVCYNANQ